MTPLTPREQRLLLIEGMRVEAARMLSAASYDPMRDVVRLAARDLTDAALWLHQEDGALSPSILRLVDLTIDLATRRLAVVDHALKSYHSGAIFG